MSHSIITGSGDDGTTGLLSGKRVSKTDLRIETCGAVHELNAQLGILRTHLEEISRVLLASQIEKIQSNLSALCGQIAADESSAVEFMGKECIAEIEKKTRQMEETLPPLKQFILPGGTITAAHTHLASAVCRRAERRLIAITEDNNLSSDNLKNGLIYLNRLSDYLFVLAREQGRKS